MKKLTLDSESVHYLIQDDLKGDKLNRKYTCKMQNFLQKERRTQEMDDEELETKSCTITNGVVRI